MGLLSFEHFLVCADDIEKTKEFYVDLLGLELGVRPDFGFPGYWLYLNGSACVHVADRKIYNEQVQYLGQREINSGTGPIDHIAFNGEDMASFRTRLDNAGVEYKHRVIPDFNVEQLFINDPDGIMVELNFFEPAKPA